MGVSKAELYKVTAHCSERYLGRIDNKADHLTIKKHITIILHNSTFLRKENKNRESWFNEKEEVITIIEPKKLAVVTLFKNRSQYEEEYPDVETKKEEKQKVIDCHPEVAQLMAEHAAKVLKAKKRERMRELGPLYKEFGERMTKLSSTHDETLHERKSNELQEVNRKITERNQYYKEILSSLDKFIKLGDVGE